MKKKTQIEKDNPKKWSDYKKFVESIRYKDYKIKIDPVAKYPGQLDIRYRYMAQRPNYEGSGVSGHTILYPLRVEPKTRLFTGFDNLMDFRIQCRKKDFIVALKKLEENSTRLKELLV